MSDLPEGWTQVPLAAITSEVTQREPSDDETIRYIDIGSVNRTTKAIETPQKLLGKDAPSRARKQVAAGDTLVSMTRPNLNAVALVPKELDGEIASTGFDVLRPIPGIDPRWISYLVRTEKFVDSMSALVQGALYPAVRAKDVRAHVVPLAPAAEQTRIANQLDTLLTRIQSCNDRFDAIPALLKRFRQTVLTAGASGALTTEWRGTVSTDGWETCSVGQVLEGKPRNGYSPQAVDYETSIRSLTLSATTSGKFLALHSKFIGESIADDSHLWLEPGDILIQRANSLEHVGVSAVFDGAAKQFIYPDLMMKCRPNGRIRNKYLFYALSAESTRNYFRKHATGTAGNMPKINQQTVMSAPLLLPPLDEQTEIVRRVDALFALADRIEARCTAARAQAQRLTPLVLAKAFRGELVQQDPQDEPASVLLQRLAATKPTKVAASRGRPRTKQKEIQPTPLVLQPNWTALPDDLWAAPEDVDAHAVVAVLVAVLKAWGGPMPQAQARLAAVLCQQPRLMTAALPAEQAMQWRRLVGSLADPLPTQVTLFHPATSSQWRKALAGMRARGDLVETGTTLQGTWALGSGAAQIETAGWPDGRAGWVVAYLRAHDIETILPVLETPIMEFVYARAV